MAPSPKGVTVFDVWRGEDSWSHTKALAAGSGSALTRSCVIRVKVAKPGIAVVLLDIVGPRRLTAEMDAKRILGLVRRID